MVSLGVPKDGPGLYSVASAVDGKDVLDSFGIEGIYVYTATLSDTPTEIPEYPLFKIGELMRFWFNPGPNDIARLENRLASAIVGLSSFLADEDAAAEIKHWASRAASKVRGK